MDLAAAAGSRRRLWRALAWALALGAAGLVFAAYRDPHTMVDLAGRLWACF